MCGSIKNIKRKQVVLMSVFAIAFLYASDPGLNAFHKGEYEKALNYYRERQIKEKENEILQYNRGTAALALDEMDDTASYLTRSLSSDDHTQLAKAHYNLGQIALRRQDNGDALSHFKKSVLYDPDDRDSKIMYEYLLRLKEQEEEQKNEDGEEQDNDQNGCDRENDPDGDNKDTDEPGDQSSDKEQDDQSGDQEREEEELKPGDSQLTEDDLTPQELSREQAKNILNAMREQEMESMKNLILNTNREKNIKRGNEW
jgi:Ca-activated chloride channel homolog